MRTAPTLDDFLADDGSRFIRVGDLQQASESLRELKAAGVDPDRIAGFEELITRMENTCALLVRLIEERMRPPTV